LDLAGFDKVKDLCGVVLTVTVHGNHPIVSGAQRMLKAGPQRPTLALIPQVTDDERALG
jgi:hypothetical protein